MVRCHPVLVGIFCDIAITCISIVGVFSYRSKEMMPVLASKLLFVVSVAVSFTDTGVTQRNVRHKVCYRHREPVVMKIEALLTKLPIQ